MTNVQKLRFRSVKRKQFINIFPHKGMYANKSSSKRRFNSSSSARYGNIRKQKEKYKHLNI